MTKNKLLYLDTETTDTQTKDIIQLAFITDDPEINLNMYFNPVHEISFGAMAVHNITPEDLVDYPKFEDAKIPKECIDKRFKGENLRDYLNFLSDEYVWVAHNADFDAEVLQKKDVNVPEMICTLKVARHSLTTPEGRDLESYRLQYLRYYLGLYKKENKDHIQAHDALSDVYFLRDLYKYFEENTKLSIENMLLISKQPQVMREMSFGQYAGKTFEEIEREDRGYLEWVVSNMNDKPDLQWNAQLALDKCSRGRTQSLF